MVRVSATGTKTLPPRLPFQGRPEAAFLTFGQSATSPLPILDRHAKARAALAERR